MRLARYSWLLALFLVIGSLIPSSTPAKGVVIGPPHALNANGHWSTTSEFDAGTKGQPVPTDGNYNIETITDNGAISSNRIDLANMNGDRFSLSDADGVTFKWAAMDLSPYNTCGTIDRAIGSGVYYLNISSTGNCIRGTILRTTVSGDYSVQIRLTLITNGTSAQHEFDVFTTARWCGSGGYGMMLYMTSTAVNTDKCLNGAASNVASSALTTNPIYLRINRSGTTLAAYSSADAVTWTARSSATNAGFSGDMYVMFTEFQSSSGPTRSLYDDFLVNNGTLGPLSYRTSGDWTSDHYTLPSGQIRVGFINLTFTGVTSTYAIDKVELYRNDVLREVFANDITGGTNANITVNEVIEGGHNASVRIYLKGDGAGTPTITSVQLFLVTLANTVVTVVAYQVGAHSAILAGNVSYDAEPDGKLFVSFNYGTTPQVGRTANVGWVSTGGNFTVLLYELDPNQVYYFQAQAQGNVSGFADGVVASFTTQGAGGMSTLLIVLLIMFVLLLLLGFKFPIMHIFGGIEGVFLGLEIFNELGDTALAGIVAGVAVLFVLIGAARIYDGVRT